MGEIDEGRRGATYFAPTFANTAFDGQAFYVRRPYPGGSGPSPNPTDVDLTLSSYAGPSQSRPGALRIDQSNAPLHWWQRNPQRLGSGPGSMSSSCAQSTISSSPNPYLFRDVPTPVYAYHGSMTSSTESSPQDFPPIHDFEDPTKPVKFHELLRYDRHASLQRQLQSQNTGPWHLNPQYPAVAGDVPIDPVLLSLHHT
jgi:hypothetical protein